MQILEPHFPPPKYQVNLSPTSTHTDAAGERRRLDRKDSERVGTVVKETILT